MQYKMDEWWYDSLEEFFASIDNCSYILLDRAEFQQLRPAIEREKKEFRIIRFIGSDVVDQAAANLHTREETVAAQQRREEQERETEKAAVTAQRQAEAVAKAEAEQRARAVAELEAKQQTRQQEEAEAGRRARAEKLTATGISLVDGYEFYTEMRSNPLKSSLKYTGQKIQITGLMATGVNVLGGQAVLTLEDHIVCKIESRDDQLIAADAKRTSTTIEGTVESISSGTAIIGRCRMICQFRDCPQ